MKIYHYLALTLLHTGSAALWAQTEHAHPEIEELIVTTTPLGESAADLAQPVTILSGYELEEKKAASIGETLAQEPGVSSSDFGQAVGRPVIRGLVGPRVRVLDDGLGSMDLASLSGDHAVSIEPFYAEQIEVLRGPSTLLYGSGAIGGVINVVDKRIPTAAPAKAWSGRLQGAVGSVADEHHLLFELDGGGTSLAWHLQGLRREADDYEIPGFATVTALRDDDEQAGRVENSDMQMKSGAAGLSWLGDGQIWGIALSRMDNNYGLPGHHHHEEEENEEEEAHHDELGPRLDMTQDRVDIKGLITIPFGPFERVSVRVGRNDYQHTELEDDGAAGTVFSNDEREARLELQHVESAGWRGAIGVHYHDREYSALGEEALIPPVDTRSLGIFMVEHRHWRQWNLEMGLRLENHEHQPSDATARDFDVASYSIGGLYRFNDRNTMSVSLSHSERALSAEELFSFGPHLVSSTFERGNPDMRKEVANNIDVSLRRQSERLRWQIGFFINMIDDYVYLQSQDSNNDGIADHVDEEGMLVAGEDELLRVDYAQQGAEFSGMEAELGVELLHTDTRKLEWTIFADTVKGELDDGANVAQLTPRRLGTGLSYHQNLWRLSLDVIGIDKQSHVAPLETPTAGYTLVNVAYTYSIFRPEGNIDLFVKGSNLGDQEARRHTSFLKNQAPLPGRALQAGLTLAF